MMSLSDTLPHSSDDDKRIVKTKWQPEPPSIAKPTSEIVTEGVKSKALDDLVLRGGLRTINEGFTLPTHATSVALTGRASDAPIREIAVTYGVDAMRNRLLKWIQQHPEQTRLLIDAYNKSGHLANKALLSSGLADVISPILNHSRTKAFTSAAGRFSPAILVGQLIADCLYYYAHHLNTQSADSKRTLEQRLHQTHKALKALKGVDDELYNRLKDVYEHLVNEDLNNRRIFEDRPTMTLEDVEHDYPHVYDK
jgi:hypothetical protein